MQLFGGVGQMGGLSSLLGSMNRSSDSTTRSSNSRAGTAQTTPESNTVPRTPSAPRSRIGNRLLTFTPGTEESPSAVGGSSGNKAATSSEPADAENPVQIDLSTGIAGSKAINVLTSDSDKVNKLAVLLPQIDGESEDKKKQVKETIASPQFQQALSLFSNALQTAQLGPVVSHFELTPEAVAAAYAGNLEDFIKALEKALPAGTTLDVAKEDTAQPMEHSGEEESKPADKQEKE